jgi:hypothetical protein
LGLLTSSIKQWLPVQSLHLFFLPMLVLIYIYILLAYMYIFWISSFAFTPLSHSASTYHMFCFIIEILVHFREWLFFSVILYMQIFVTLVLQTCMQVPYFCNCWVLWRKHSVHALICIDPCIITLSFCLLFSKQFSWLDDLLVGSCKICCLVCEPWTTEVMKTIPHRHNCGSMECFE